MYIFGRRLDVVAAADFDNLRRQLCAAEGRINQLQAQHNNHRHDTYYV
ncbi:hypothetical protein QS468_42745 [Bacillus subtilis]|nr:hypothetical protein [Pseudomonas sp. A29(2023)]MDL5599494.1 hypothetical protein [Bacillus subtilis]